MDEYAFMYGYTHIYVYSTANSSTENKKILFQLLMLKWQ